MERAIPGFALQSLSGREELFDELLEESDLLPVGLKDRLHSSLSPAHLPLQTKDKTKDDKCDGDEESQSPLEGVESAIDGVESTIDGVESAVDGIEPTIHLGTKIIDALVECRLAFFEPLLQPIESCVQSRKSLHDLPVADPGGDLRSRARSCKDKENKKEGTKGKQQPVHTADCSPCAGQCQIYASRLHPRQRASIIFFRRNLPIPFYPP